MKRKFIGYVYNLAKERKNKKKIDKTEDYDKYVVRMLIDLAYAHEDNPTLK